MTLHDSAVTYDLTSVFFLVNTFRYCLHTAVMFRFLIIEWNNEWNVLTVSACMIQRQLIS